MKEAKKLSKKDIQRHLQATKKAIAAGKVVTINPNAVINIPVAGAFRDYIAEAINYLFTLKDEDTITSTLMHIRAGFKSLPEDAPYDPYMNAVSPAVSNEESWAIEGESGTSILMRNVADIKNSQNKVSISRICI